MMNKTLIATLVTTLGLAAPVFAQEAAAQAIGAGVGLIIVLSIAIVIGGVVGWLASLLVKGSGSGFWGDVMIGIGGSLLASILLRVTGAQVSNGIVGLVAMFLGAVLLLLIVKFIRKT